MPYPTRKPAPGPNTPRMTAGQTQGPNESARTPPPRPKPRQAPQEDPTPETLQRQDTGASLKNLLVTHTKNN